jgi:cell division protease FtsH
LDTFTTFLKNLSLWLIIGLVGIFLYNLFNTQPEYVPEIPYSDFVNRVINNEVAKVTIEHDKVTGAMVTQEAFRTGLPPQDTEIMKLLKQHNVTVHVKPKEETPLYLTMFISWFPMLILIGVWIFFMRQMQPGGGRAMSFGRSRAKLLSSQNITVTFEDVAGIDEAKA